MLKGKIILYIVIALSLLIRINFEITNADMYNDKVIQIGAAKNLINGHGLSISSVSFDDITKIKSTFLTIWPPGYSLLIIPFYYIANDFLNASIIIDIICVILLYQAILMLLNCLNISWKRQMYLFVFLGLSFTPFYHLNSTDLISLTFFQWAVYLSVYYLKYNTKLFQISILSGLFLFFTGFMRYSYYPLMFAVPLALFLIGLSDKQRKTIQFAVISGAVSAILLITQTYFIKLFSGNLYRSFNNGGLYPNNLLKIDAFPFKSFFFYEGFLDKIFKSYPFIEPVFIIASYLFSIIIIFEIFRFIFNKQQTNRLLKYFLIIGLTALIVNVLFLSYMSLTHKGETWKTPPWTFVEATRYYSQSMLFLEIIVFAFILHDQYINKALKFLYKCAVYIIIFVALIYWLNNNYNVYIKKDIKYTFKGIYREELQLSNIIRFQTNSNKFTIFSSPNGNLNDFVYIITNVDALLYDYNSLVKNYKIISNKAATLYIAVPRESSNTGFLSKYSSEKIDELKYFSLYKINLN